jgi:hypothetical protein
MIRGIRNSRAEGSLTRGIKNSRAEEVYTKQFKIPKLRDRLGPYS